VGVGNCKISCRSYQMSFHLTRSPHDGSLGGFYVFFSFLYVQIIFNVVEEFVNLFIYTLHSVQRLTESVILQVGPKSNFCFWASSSNFCIFSLVISGVEAAPSSRILSLSASEVLKCLIGVTLLWWMEKLELSLLLPRGRRYL